MPRASPIQRTFVGIKHRGLDALEARSVLGVRALCGLNMRLTAIKSANDNRLIRHPPFRVRSGLLGGAGLGRPVAALMRVSSLM